MKIRDNIVGCINSNNAMVLFCITLLTILFSFSPSACTAEPATLFTKNKASKKKSYNVLIIDSFHHGHFRSNTYIDKIQNMLTNSGLPVESHIVHLDSERINNRNYNISQLKLFLQQYRPGYFDLIITFDNNAAKTLEQSSVVGNLTAAPLISLGISADTDFSYSNMIKIPDQYYLKENIDLIFKLFPNTENIAIISGNRNLSKNRFQQIKKFINEKTNVSAIYFNQDKFSVNNILQKLNTLPDNTVVFIETLYNEKNAEYPNLQSFYSKICSKSPFPVFSNSKTVIAAGALGGIVQNIEAIINVVSSITFTLLTSDSNTEKLPEYDIDSLTTVFNWNAMLIHNADYQVLPENTIYLNRPHNSFGNPNRKSHILNILYHSEPPLIYSDQKGSIHGILADLWKLWSAKNNLPINFQDISNLDMHAQSKLYQENATTVYAGKTRIFKPGSNKPEIKLLISTASVYSNSTLPVISDWKDLEGKKIAIADNESYKEFLKSKITNVQITTYRNNSQLFDDLENNNFDAFFMEDITAHYLLKRQGLSNLFVSNNLCTSKIEIVIVAPDHLSARAANRLIKIIQSGMNSISFKTVHEIFSPFLNGRIRSYPILTYSEKQYLAARNTLKTNSLTDWQGMEMLEKDEFHGLIPDLLQLIAGELNTTIEFSKSDKYANKATLLLNNNLDFLDFASDSTQKNLLYTLPYLKLPAVAVSKTGQQYINDTNTVIAVPSTYITYYYFFREKFPENTIILTRTPQDAIEMIHKDICDFAIMDNITANRLTALNRYSCFSQTLLHNFQLSFSMGMLDTPDNRVLLKILNNIIVTIPQNKITELINKYTYDTTNRLTLRKILLILLPVIIIFTILLLILWGYTTRKALIKLNISETALRKEKSWLNATMHSIGEGMIATDVTGIIMQMNSVAEELVHASEEDAKGMYTSDLFSLYNFSTSEKFPDPVSSVLESRQPINFHQNITLRNKAHTEIPITATATPIKESNKDNIIGVVFIFKDIRAEAIYKRQLSQTKTLLSNAISLAGVTYFTYDLKNNKILLSSGKEESYLYVTDKTFNLKEIFINVVDSDMDVIRTYWHELLNRQIQRFTVNYKVTEDQGLRYKRADIVSEKDNKGDITRIFGVKIDITNVIKAEKEKQIAAQRIEQAYNLAKLAYMEFLPLTQRINFDEKVGDMFMLENNTSNELSFDELFINANDFDKNQFKDFMENSTQHRIENYEQKIRIVKNNTGKTLKIFANNSYENFNTLIRSSGAVLDITELYQMQNELKASEEQKRIILSSIKEAVAYLSSDYKVIWVNEATRDMFGCDPEKIIGKPCCEIFNNEISLCKKCKKANFDNSCDNTLVDSFSYNNKELLVSTNAIRDIHDNITHFVKTFSDISEMKEIENNLKEAYERADTANKAKSTFLSTMTHEIRTPLNAIIGFSDLLQYEEMNTNSGSYAHSIKTAATGLLNLINNVLDFSRMEANKLTLNISHVIIESLLEEVKQIFINKARNKDIELLFKTNSNIPPLLLDKDRLRQVIINLVGNAIKFTPQGSVTITTAIRETENKSSGIFDLSISIADTGIGINADKQIGIFNSFEQIENNSNRKYEGTGLGLSISKRLVELMNGEIILTSRINSGSKFTVILHDVEASPDFTEKVSPENFHLTCFKPANILVISKEYYSQNIYSNILEKLQLTFTSCATAEDAIRKLQKNKFQLVISSLTNSAEAAARLPQQIHDLQGYRDIPLIGLTSHSAPSENFDTSLYSDIIIIPVTLLNFTKVLEKYLEKQDNPAASSIPAERETEIFLSQEIIDIVYEKFGSRFYSLKHGLILEDAKKIAEEFIDFAQKFDDNNLIHIANKLDQYIATFKLPDITKTINIFLENRDDNNETT